MGFGLEAGNVSLSPEGWVTGGHHCAGLKMFHLEFICTHAGPIPVSCAGFCQALPCTGCILMLYPIRMLGIKTFQPKWKQCPWDGCHSLTVSAKRKGRRGFDPSFVYTLC